MGSESNLANSGIFLGRPGGPRRVVEPMARLPRLFLPEYPVHLVVRGNDRQDIFRSEGDRVFFHRCLVETTRKHAASVHAYVFMSNHVHLLASANTADALSKVIQSMG